MGCIVRVLREWEGTMQDQTPFQHRWEILECKLPQKFNKKQKKVVNFILSLWMGFLLNITCKATNYIVLLALNVWKWCFGMVGLLPTITRHSFTYLIHSSHLSSCGFGLGKTRKYDLPYSPCIVLTGVWLSKAWQSVPLTQTNIHRTHTHTYTSQDQSNWHHADNSLSLTLHRQ